MPVVNRHAPLRKLPEKHAWLDHKTNEHMKQRDQAKKTTILTGYESDWIIHGKLRNCVTNLNRTKTKLYHENRIIDIKHYNKNLLILIISIQSINKSQHFGR